LRYMRKTLRFSTALVLFMCALYHVQAQSVPVVAIYQLSARDVGDAVTRTVADLIHSFIRELKTYRVVDLRNESLPRDLGVPEGVDYIFYGSLVNQPDGIKLELVLKGGALNTTRLISRVYENSNRILLESRILVRDLFDQSVTLPDPPAAIAGSDDAGQPLSSSIQSGAVQWQPVKNIDALAGAWRGEDGVERIMILRGGRGVAVLSSGVSVSLELMISGEELVVRQKGAPTARQFMDLPDPVARQAAAIAPSLEWRFLLSDDQKNLGGTKKTVVIRNDGKNILAMESRIVPVQWIRE